MIKEGLTKFKEKKFCEAINIFKKLTKLNPENGDVLFTLGNIYYVLNDLNKSSFYFRSICKALCYLMIFDCFFISKVINDFYTFLVEIHF